MNILLVYGFSMAPAGMNINGVTLEESIKSNTIVDDMFDYNQEYIISKR